VDTRSRIVQATTELVEASGAQQVSTRAICEAAGITAPTLYHHFADKQALYDAVAAAGFDRYLAEKRASSPSGDPVEDVRHGWDTQVQFGVEHPALYALMYASAREARSPAAAQAHDVLVGMLEQAARTGRLAGDIETAAGAIEAAVVGVTLHAIRCGQIDQKLCTTVREAVLAAVLIDGSTGGQTAGVGSVAAQLLALLSDGQPAGFSIAESALLRQWLHRLAASAG
jgi:AcrR family transcriptional regulator